MLADESIIFEVSDNGSTERLAAAFDKLEISGARALELLRSKFVAYEADSQRAGATQEIVNTYFLAGGENANKLAAALSRLDEMTLLGAAGNKEFLASLQNVAIEEQAVSVRVIQAEEAKAAARAAALESVYAEADAQLAASARMAEALHAEEEAYSINAAYRKEQSLSAAYSVQESYKLQESAMAQWAETQRAANASGLQGDQVLADQMRMNSAARVEALSAEEARFSEHGVRMYEIARTEAYEVNAAFDKMAAQAAAATTKMVTEQEAALGRLGGLFTGMIGQIAAFASAAAFIKDIDVTTNINRQISALIPNLDQANAAFNHIADTAIATQQPVEGVAKAFTGLYASMKEQGKSAEEAAVVTDSLGKLFYATGTKASEAARSMHDLTEAFATGTLSGQQLMSLERQAPAAFSLLTEALGINRKELSAHTLMVERAQDRVNKLTAAMGTDAPESVGKATSALNANESKVKTLTVEIDKQTQSITRLMQARGNHTAEIAKERAAMADNETKLNEARGAHQGLADALTKSTDASKASKQAQLDLANATLKVREGITAQALEGVLASESFRNKLNQLSQDGQTVKGAFTALDDEIVKYIHSTGDAQAATSVVGQALRLVGTNLNIIIPTLGALGAAFVALKLIDVAKDIYLVVQAFTVFVATVNPIIAILTAVGLGVAYVATQTDVGRKALGYLADGFIRAKDAMLGLFGATQEATKATSDNAVATDTVQLSVTNLTSKQLEQLNAQRNVGASSTALVNSARDMIKANTDNSVALQASNEAMVVQAQAAKDVSDGLNTANDNLQQFVTVTDDATGKTTSKWQDLGTAIDTNMNNALTNVNAQTTQWATQENQIIQTVIDKLNAVSQAAQGLAGGTGGGGSGAAVPASRDGSAFTVPAFARGGHFTAGGSGGVDSQLIAVSPGEHVTVQTPEQFYGGKVNQSAPGTKRFRDGGTFDNATFKAAGSSTTGYSAPTAAGYYTNAAAQAVTALATSIASATQTIAQVATTTAQTIQDTRQSIGNTLSTAAGTTSSSAGTVVDFAEAKRQANIKAAQAASANDTTAYGLSMFDRNKYKYGATDAVNVVGQGLQPVSSLGVKPIKILANRDGGDYMVPGGSAGDERVIKLAVNPGERISVRTPQQQQANQRPGSAPRGASGGNITMNVYTRDANSFGQSESQLLATAKRKMARVG